MGRGGVEPRRKALGLVSFSKLLSKKSRDRLIAAERDRKKRRRRDVRPFFSFFSFKFFEKKNLTISSSPPPSPPSPSPHHNHTGCSEANTEPVWRCRGHSVCSPSATTQHVLYGWAKDAPPAGVPEGAAFRVGHGTGTRSLVMQVHFTTRRPPGDKSGVRLHLGAGGGAAPFSAGLTMFARYFQIPPREPEVKVPNQCCLRGFEPQHAFAFRVHAHDMGRYEERERERE